GTPRGLRLPPPDEEVVEEHETDRAEDQDDVDPPDPGVDARPHIARLTLGDVDLAAGEVRLRAFVALAAGLLQGGGVDRGARVGGRQDVVRAVAARAVR